MLFHQNDLDEVQVVSSAGLHGLAVANGIFVFLPEPVRPYLFVGYHLLHTDNLGKLTLTDDVKPVIYIVHIVHLFRRPGQEQLWRQMIVTVLLHCGHGDIDPAAFAEKGQQLLIQVFGIAAEVIVGIRADDSVKAFLFKG